MLDSLVHGLNDITPLGLAAGLAYIIYQLAAKKGQIRTISENHLSGLPEMSVALGRIEELLSDIKADLAYVKGRLNGK